MTPNGQTSAQLATFDLPLAEAVVTVLEQEGIATIVAPHDGQEVEVLVPAERRDEALALLADRMEQIHQLVKDAGAATATSLPLTDRTVPDTTDDDETGPPIVMERLRRMSFGLVILLAPLLVISLSGALPIGYALALFILGLVGIVYWRNRQDEDGGDED